MKDTGDLPAFPQDAVYYPSGQIEYGYPGMTLRAYIATEVLKPLIGNSGANMDDEIRTAIMYADAMIASLENHDKVATT